MADMQALLAQLVQAQGEAQKAQQAQAQQFAAAQQAQAQQLQAALAQLAAFQQKQTEQVEQTSKLSLARATAGVVPVLRGQTNTIEAHRWGITMETWFATAGVAADADKVSIATSSFKETAQAWWASEQQAGNAAALNTWVLLLAAVKKQFLPMDVEDWAKSELAALVKKPHADVLDYTARYKELNQLVQQRDDTDRRLLYVNGLPEAYQIKCAENKYKTLAEASEAAVRWHNAKQMAKTQMAGAAGLHAIDGTGFSDADGLSQASSSSSLPQYGEGRGPTLQPGSSALHNVSAGPQRVSSLEEQMAQLTQTVMAWQQRGGGGGGRGRERGGRGGSRGGSRSRSTSRMPIWERLKISRDTYYDRMKNNQCWQCGAAGHRNTDCPQKQSN
jgi:hypothetical protein